MTDCWPTNIWCGAGRNVTPLSITEHLKSFSPTGCLWQWKVSSEVINYYQLQQASKPASRSIKFQERCVVYGGAWCGCVSPPTSADIWDWDGPNYHQVLSHQPFLSLSSIISSVLVRRGRPCPRYSSHFQLHTQHLMDRKWRKYY